MDSLPTIIANDESKFEKFVADTKPLSDAESSDEPSKITIEKQELASMIDAAVDSVLSRVGNFLLEQEFGNVDRDAAAFSHAEKLAEDLKAEHRNHTTWLELKHKEWKREDRTERRRRGRSFEDLVKQAFLHVDVVGAQVIAGRYDIVNPEGHVILPSLWEEIIEPGWELGMHMRPMRLEGQESLADDDGSIIDEHLCPPAGDGGRPQVPVGPLGNKADEGSQCASIGSCQIVDDPVAERGSPKKPTPSSLSQKINSKTEQDGPDGEIRHMDVIVLLDEPVHDAVYGEWDAFADD